MKFRRHSDASLRESAAIISGPMPATELEDMQKRQGLKHHRFSLISCPDLRGSISPSKSVHYDFMHCFLSGGTLPFELDLFIEAALQKEDLKLAPMFNTCIQKTVFPRGRNHKPALFATAGDHAYLGGASDLLTIHPAIREFVRRMFARWHTGRRKRFIPLSMCCAGWLLHCAAR